MMGRNASTILREWQRNGGRNTYNPHLAHIRANRYKSKARHIKITPPIWGEIKHRIKNDHTPEQVSGRFKYEGIISISPESIYKNIYKEAKLGDKTYKQLPRAERQRRPRLPLRKGARKGKHPSVSIDNRPKEIETRETVRIASNKKSPKGQSEEKEPMQKKLAASK